jgi:Family of unknown function (DUF6545)
MSDGFASATLAVLWLVSAARLTTMGRSHRHTVSALTFVTVAFGATVNQAGVTAFIDNASGVADLAVLVKNLLEITAVGMFIELVALLDEHGSYVTFGLRTRRIPQMLMVIAAVGMTALFLVVPRRMGGGDFVDEQAGTAMATAYGLLNQGCVTLGLVSPALLFWRQSRRAAPGPLRVGLRMLTASMWVGMLYVGNRVVFLTTHAAGSQVLQGPGYVMISRTLFSVALLLFAGGSALPVSRYLHSAIRHHLALYRLYTLWQPLRLVFPEVVLGDPPGRWSDLLPTGDARLRLYRRIIEIRDAQLLLAEYVDREVQDKARQFVRLMSVPGAQAASAEQACVLEIGLRTARAGCRSVGMPAVVTSHAGSDLEADLDELLGIVSFLPTALVREFADSVEPSTIGRKAGD